MLEPHYILRRPLLTEKSTQAMESANMYTFEVDRRASKRDIKAAVEKAFGVTVEKVNTQNRKGGSRRFRYGTVEAGEWKRATVRIAEGQKIDLF
ncbi:MAG: 50S ribosomal protein L23 [Planctomycetota bacterium]|nr:MAG: 50S ribosomal protein L23 [Planctomycetota bacterium]